MINDRDKERPFMAKFIRSVAGIAAAVGVAVVVAAPPATATVKMAEATNQGCEFCHPKDIRIAGPAGLYYQENGTLDGYEGMEVVERLTADDCLGCHDESWEVNPQRRKLEDPHTDKAELKHGDGAFWCLRCHSADHRNKLKLMTGEEIDWPEAPRLCGQCHGPIYRDWKAHIHGRWAGEVANATPARLCPDCHNPHDPKFKPLPPEPAPQHPDAPPASPDLSVVAIGGTIIALLLTIFAATGRRD